MRKHHLVIGILLLSVSLAYWLWPKGTSQNKGEERANANASEIEKRRDARRSGNINTSPASISGQVFAAESKAPIAGAMVSIALRKIDGGLVGQAGQTSAPLATKTDADGRYQIDMLRPGRYSVSTTMKGFKPQHVDGILLEGGQQQKGVDFALQPGGHLVTGIVTDIGGGPVGFAFVRARRNSEFTVSSFFRAPLTATTNSEGEYELNLGDGSYSFDVYHEDYRTEKRNLSVGGQDRRVDFVLTPGSVIEGVVLLASDDSPVDGATVTWVPMGRAGGFLLSGVTMNGSAETDSDGKFALRGLGSGALELRAHSAHSSSREPTIVELSIAETVSDVVVYVDDAYMVSGFVVNKGADKEAATDVMLGAYNIAPGALYAANTPSASDGYFEIHGVQPGSYTVGAVAEEKLPNFFGEAITVVDKDLTDVVVTVDGGYTLSGNVTPPQVATITLQVDMNEVGFSNVMQAAGSFLVRTKSDVDGNFALKGVGQGSYSLVATAESGNKGSVDVEVAGDVEGLAVEMEDRASASGVVVDAGGHPVEGVEVRFRARDVKKNQGFRMGGPNARGDATYTGADGRFEHVGLEDGDFDVEVHDGSQLAWAGVTDAEKKVPKLVTVSEGQDVRNLRLEVEARNHKLSGTVQDPEGALLPDAWVTAYRVGDVGDVADPDEEEREGRRRRRRWRSSETPVLTDADGAFVIKELRSGLYDLTAEATRGGAKGDVTRVKMDTRVNIRIEKLGKLVGKVTKAGAPVKDYILSVNGPQRRRIHVARDTGAFQLPRLEAGEYNIEVTSAGGVASAKAKVTPGEEAVANIQLAAFGSITGTLIDAATGEPMPKISAVATMKRDETKFASNALELMTGVGPSTGDEGEFRVGKLGTGKGTLYFMDPKAKGFDIIAQKEFDLGAGEDLDLGEIHGTQQIKVPEDERGTLGMFTIVDAKCPLAEPEGAPEPAEEGEAEPATQHLWIVSVDAGGPAESAGAKQCDRITQVQGVDVAVAGPTMVSQLLIRGIKAGETTTISVDRDSGPTTLSIVAELENPSDSDEPEKPEPSQ
jgi:protocatechuate 3,4-dioxygenase beta subunit